ncbi:hypothetical protein BEN51_05015 [Clostridium isatidis]|uniref:Thoeris protein ThsA Macro domain-containing protein n=1 Tax=Clostridium isatidis TaxID=182773 RepID=A0A343JBE3_9CLOT|nr:hypothetical protein BEN51_05015 [Clostridium isatidis]
MERGYKSLFEKQKVSLSDKALIRDFLAIVGIIGGLYSYVTIFFEIPDEYKNKVINFAIVSSILVIIYLVLWIRANKMESIKLKINGSTIQVKIGDIFEEKELKVISFNEYFDTQVDDDIIANSSLNGIFITSKLKESIEDFDKELDKYLSSKKGNEYSVNNDRVVGKKKKYPLGTICKYKNEYLFTALTKFDDENKAKVLLKDYVYTLLNFWSEIDRVYAGKSVSMPLLGSGQTRIEDKIDILEQELLELLIWTFKISRIKIKHPSKITIIIHSTSKDKINFYKLKELM